MIGSGTEAGVREDGEPQPEGSEAQRALTVPWASAAPRPRRRSLRLVWLALVVLLVAPLAVWYALWPRPEPAPAGGRENEVRAAESAGPSQPAQELAAVLDLLYRNPAPPRPETSPAQPQRGAAAAPAIASPETIRAVQERLADIGYLRAPPADAWTPEALQALREFKTAQGLAPDSVPDEATEQALYEPAHLESAPFVGVWAPDLAACAPRNRTRFLTAVINHKGAWAGDVSCSFAEPRREGETWSFAAVCSRGRNRWTSNVRLTPSGDVLTWASERGTQRYLRCPGGEPRPQR